MRTDILKPEEDTRVKLVSTIRFRKEEFGALVQNQVYEGGGTFRVNKNTYKFLKDIQGDTIKFGDIPKGIRSKLWKFNLIKICDNDG